MASQSADTGGDGNQDHPYVRLSDPFVERLIGTIRREYLDHILFWTTADLENKLLDFRTTSTTIARIPHGKGERRIRPCHEQSRIPARFDGNHTVGPSIRHRWLPDFSKIRARYGIWSTSANLPRNQPVFLHRSVLRGSGRFTATWCVPKGRLTFTARLPVESVPP